MTLVDFRPRRSPGPPSHPDELVVVAERDGFGKPVRTLSFVELLLDGLPERERSSQYVPLFLVMPTVSENVEFLAVRAARCSVDRKSTCIFT